MLGRMAVFHRYRYHHSLPIQRPVKLLFRQYQREGVQRRGMVVQVPNGRVGSDCGTCVLLQ